MPAQLTHIFPSLSIPEFLNLLRLRLRKLLTALTTPYFRKALFHARVVPSLEHWYILARPWRTVVDIGANRCQFTLAARVWSSARVHAFEPLPQAAALFRAAVGADEHVILHPYAIGPKSEERVIHVARRDDSSSLLKIGPEQSRLFPGTDEVAQLTVTVRPLRTFLENVDIAAPALLKLDVQGFEYEAILGCLELLNSFDEVICECSFVQLYRGQKLASDVIALLSEHGFVVSGVYNAAYDRIGRCIQADLLFSSDGAQGVGSQ